MAGQKITTFLWFDSQADEAARFYIATFGTGSVKRVSPGPDGKPLTVSFELFGQDFIALNGGPHFRFTEAISLFVTCETQAEVDELWAKLIADGGQESMCGWLKDKYGLSWQIIPAALPRLLGHPDRTKARRVMDVMLTMRKIDIGALERAAAG